MGLSLTNVSYLYKNAQKGALNNVSCRFDEGKCYAVVGPSGSGKTTLLSIMAGLDTPQFGAVSVDGRDISGMNLDEYRRRKVAIIFQAFQLFPLLTAQENVCYPLELQGTPKRHAKRKAAALLERVGIAPEKHRRYPAHLSGGEQQRVAIARALSTGAKIILADEPTGNLDVENGSHIMDILTALAHDGRYCVVIVTHDMDIAAKADSVYKMSDGALLAVR